MDFLDSILKYLPVIKEFHSLGTKLLSLLRKVFKRDTKTDTVVINHQGHYVTLANDESNNKYCPICWYLDKKLIPIEEKRNGSYYCHVCKKTGVCDEARYYQSPSSREERIII